MVRVFVMPVLVVLASVVPSVVHAQYAVVSPCGGAYNNPSVWDCARVSVIPAPPTGVPAWLQPAPLPPPVVQPVPPMPLMPTYTPPVYVNPVLVLPGRGIDPWIPLSGLRTPAPSSDLLGQLLLLQALRASRPRPQAAPASAPVYVPPPPPAPTGANWMNAYIKGVTSAK